MYRTIEHYRPEHSLSLIGVDVESGMESVIGCIIVKARPGDILISFPERRPGRNYLVLRRAFDDVYEIIGYAVTTFTTYQITLGRQPAFQPSPIAPTPPSFPNSPTSPISPASAPEPGSFDTEPPPMLSFDLWLDAEDVIAHTMGNAEYISRSGFASVPDVSNLVNRSFTRARFSSYATACFASYPEDLDRFCAECAGLDARHICMNCGGSLHAAGSPHAGANLEDQ